MQNKIYRGPKVALGLTGRIADETLWRDISKVAKPSTLDKR